MNGHFKMFNQMLKTINESLSIDLIKSYHYQLKSGVFEDQLNGYPVGEFKNRVNRVSDIKTFKPKDVHDALKKLLAEYKASKHTLEDIAKFHARYEIIHPFQDGNGRTGRMIIVRQCFDADLIPIIIQDSKKMFYYKALHLAQVEKNYEMLIGFFKESQQDYLEEIHDFVEEFEETKSLDFF